MLLTTESSLAQYEKYVWRLQLSSDSQKKLSGVKHLKSQKYLKLLLCHVISFTV